MSHPLVAAVFEQLGRRDLENILHEIIGEHAAGLATGLALSAGHHGQAPDMESLTQSVLWIQTLFNVQRTYLQGLATSQDCHPYFAPNLISSDIVNSTLMYLTKVKMDLFPCSKPTAAELLRYRQLIGHTFLVGIRLLVLRGEPMSSDTKFRLERAMRSAWEHPDLSKSESFLINDLLPKAIASIGSTDLFHAQQALLKSSKAYVPIFSSGIYPFPGAPDTLVTDLLTALMRKQDDQLTSFYLLFDLLWAAESALIHCHIDRRRILQEQGHDSASGIKVDEAFEQTQDNRKKLARTILAAFDDEFDTPSLQVLATVILSESAGEQAPLQTRRIRDSWGKLSPLRDSTDSALGLLMRWLVNRRVQLWDCNGELEAFSHDYQKHLTQWLHSSSSQATSHPTRVRKGNNGAVYVVNCPAVHPVPEALLEQQLRSSDKKAYEQLQEKSRFLTMNAMCPLCPGKVEIQHARMIEPLDQGSDALHHTGSESSGHYSLPDSASRDTTSRSSSRTNSTDQLSRVDSVDGLRSPVSPISSSLSFFKLSGKSHSPTTSDITNPFMARPRTGQSQEKQLIRSLSKDLKSVTLSLTGTTSLFRKGSSKTRNLPRQPKFCFSASGHGLLIWDVGDGSVMRFEINSMDGRKSRGHRYDATGVQHAAAGSKRCAIVASAAEHYELLIFGNKSAIPEAYLTVETLQPSSPITCMVMSRDDRYVAFTLEDEVRVYEIDTTEIRQVRLGDKTDYYTVENALEADINNSHKTIAQNEKRAGAVVARRLQFSVDGRRFIVATHLGNQYVYVDVWNCIEQQWKLEPGGSKSFKLPPWSSDDGDLTCVFYDSFNEAVVLTAFLERAYPISFSLSSEAFTSDSVSPRIVHAAQSPSGSRFVLANGMKQMYLCDSTTSGSLIPTKMKKAMSKISPSAFRPGQLAFSFPGENEVFAFWAREGKLMLRTISLHASGETVSDYDLRSEFDRLVIERPLVTDIHRPRHQPSSLSRQIDSEIEVIQTQPVSRPSVPELPAT
ncbi:uncharacterized protein DSM5745_03388 [Aspergillus mulundensis]|uniref:Uncharacterized protein n=1 Tax=Aspergillus mulundensis TaxID=1810919 RepID=A0A3D8SKE1_9EURO|nr:Uncharacterized protein DSM5745_03388 [Aspergillus mulundensis]RDW86746.1 Uncharacterized protein DSM5745_03388 [Aspergillus mulundensis]